MSDVKQVNQAAKCVQYHLQTEGKEVSLKEIKELIKDKDLLNIAALKTLVEESMSEDKTEVKTSSRKQTIESFMKENWELIKSNEEIKGVLLGAYCQGRLTKDQRKKLADDLLERCSGDDVPSDLEDEDNNELVNELLGTNGKLDF